MHSYTLLINEGAIYEIDFSCLNKLKGNIQHFKYHPFFKYRNIDQKKRDSAKKHVYAKIEVKVLIRDIHLYGEWRHHQPRTVPKDTWVCLIK